MRTTVIFVGPDADGQGGMAAVCRALLGSELARRYDLRMIASHQVGSLTRRFGIFVRALRELRRQIKAADSPCIVHIHAAARGSLYRKALVVSFAHRWGAAVILHLHTGSGEISEFAARLGPLRTKLLRRLLRHADLVISASEAGAYELSAGFGMPRAAIVNNFVPGPLPELSSSSPHESAGTRLLYLGGFDNPVKGGQILIEALTTLRQAQAPVAATFAGDGAPPPELNRVGEWAGWLAGDAKRRSLQDAEIVVLPSTSEGLPLALLEAMAYGKAIVATRVGAIPEVMTDGQDGVLVPKADAAALAKAIDRLAGDASLRTKLGQSARDRAADFTLDRVVDRLDELYQQVLRGEMAVG